MTRPAPRPGSPVVGRLAPTPSGRLHLGNVCAFAAAWLSVRRQRGRLLLRMEDVDRARARPATEDAIRCDLRWLGLDWDEEVPRQSARDYAPWLAALAGRVYHCQCTRAMVQQGGGVYPGTCRTRALTAGAVRFRLPDEPVTFEDRQYGRREVSPGGLGDPVLRRADGEFAYTLAVVADDIADGVTEVVRGGDLLDVTAVQIPVWTALGRRPPAWMHTPLILGPDGRKLSKSHGAVELEALRVAGWIPADVWRLVLSWLGVPGAASLGDALPVFRPGTALAGPIRLQWHRDHLPTPADLRSQA